MTINALLSCICNIKNVTKVKISLLKCAKYLPKDISFSDSQYTVRNAPNVILSTKVYMLKHTNNIIIRYIDDSFII